MGKPTTPHDSRVKASFSDPRAAAGQLRALLPPDLTVELDLDALEDVTKECVEESLRPTRSDLFFKVPWKAGEHHALMVLHEHQSEPERFMALKTLRYSVNGWYQWLQRQDPPPAKLPPLISLVLYNGTRPWEEPRGLGELIDLPAPLEAVLRPFLPQATFLLDDLNVPGDDDLKARELVPQAFLALLLFKHGRRGEDLAQLWRRERETVAALVALPEWSDYLAQLSRYTYVVGDVAHEELSQVVDEAAGRAAAEVVVTTAERLREEGRTQGRTQETVRRTREILLTLLREKFPQDVTAETEATIEQADLAKLEAWVRRFAKADSLSDVFAD